MRFFYLKILTFLLALVFYILAIIVRYKLAGKKKSELWGKKKNKKKSRNYLFYLIFLFRGGN